MIDDGGGGLWSDDDRLRNSIKSLLIIAYKRVLVVEMLLSISNFIVVDLFTTERINDRTHEMKIIIIWMIYGLPAQQFRNNLSSASRHAFY